MRQRGYVLVELMVALVLSGVVSLAIVVSILVSLRFLGLQSLRASIGDNLRTGVALLAGELRELDSDGGDLIAISSDALTYRAQRNVSFVCHRPDVGQGSIVVSEDIRFGLREVEPGRDSLFILSGPVDAGGQDDVWISAGLTAVGRGASCANGAPGITYALALTDPSVLVHVREGAPVRAYQLTRLRQYRDASGQSWLGMSEWRAGSGWSVIQPVLGPLAERGLVLEYLDDGGYPTGEPRRVAQVRFTLTCIGFRAIGGGAAGVRDSLTGSVFLRNGARS